MVENANNQAYSFAAMAKALHEASDVDTDWQYDAALPHETHQAYDAITINYLADTQANTKAETQTITKADTAAILEQVRAYCKSQGLSDADTAKILKGVSNNVESSVGHPKSQLSDVLKEAMAEADPEIRGAQDDRTQFQLSADQQHFMEVQKRFEDLEKEIRDEFYRLADPEQIKRYDALQTKREKDAAAGDWAAVAEDDKGIAGVMGEVGKSHPGTNISTKAPLLDPMATEAGAAAEALKHNTIDETKTPYTSTTKARENPSTNTPIPKTNIWGAAATVASADTGTLPSQQLPQIQTASNAKNATAGATL